MLHAEYPLCSLCHSGAHCAQEFFSATARTCIGGRGHQAIGFVWVPGPEGALQQSRLWNIQLADPMILEVPLVEKDPASDEPREENPCADPFGTEARPCRPQK